MKGTSISQTLAIDFTPPKITIPVNIAMIPPEICGETPMVSLTMTAMELACTVLPIPKAAMEVKMQNKIASHFAFIPFSSAYIGPPSMVPSDVFTRYFTDSKDSAYFVAIPKTPVNQHHRTAPGPPSPTAVATPTMLPVPMVAANAVVRAPNWLTSPSPDVSLLKDSLIAVNVCF